MRVGSDPVRRVKHRAKGDLPAKICATCGRSFTWRSKWATVWDDVRYCSDRCRRERPKAPRQT